jgi:hypothetical protein
MARPLFVGENEKPPARDTGGLDPHQEGYQIMGEDDVRSGYIARSPRGADHVAAATSPIIAEIITKTRVARQHKITRFCRVAPFRLPRNSEAIDAAGFPRANLFLLISGVSAAGFALLPCRLGSLSSWRRGMQRRRIVPFPIRHRSRESPCVDRPPWRAWPRILSARACH